MHNPKLPNIRMVLLPTVSSLHSIPSTNIFCMPHKCIHMHIYEEFVIQSRIQAYKEHLWTLMDPNMYMRCVDIFPYYSLSLSSLILSKKTLSFPTSSTIV